MGLVRASRPSRKVGTLEADLREDEDGKPRPGRASEALATTENTFGCVTHQVPTAT